jgi:multiple sugar transport system permease protein
MRKFLLAIAALLTIVPFLYMVSVSFMGEAEVLRWPPPLWPHAPTLGNYAAALDALPYTRVLFNTAILAACVMAGQVLTSATAGYALARMRFVGRGWIVALLLGSLGLPAIMLVVPRFLMIETAGWTDTYAGLIVTELVSVWGIFLMRQAYLSLPRDIEEAARLDGAGDWIVFWRVALPLARPAVAAVALLAFLDQWRNFIWPLVVTRSPAMEVAEVALAQAHTAYAGNWPYQMAAAVLLSLPVAVVCLLAQRSLIAGVNFTGARVRL